MAVQEKLRKGALPKPGDESWPVPVLQQELLRTLSRLEMPRFCRKYPQLLDSLLKQLVQVVHVRPHLANTHAQHLKPAAKMVRVCAGVRG